MTTSVAFEQGLMLDWEKCVSASRQVYQHVAIALMLAF